MYHASQIEIGAELYQEHCRTCHGNRGEGLGQLGPALNDEAFFTKRLAEVGWQGTMAEYLETTIRLGRVVATRPLYAGDGIVAMTSWGQEQGGPLRPDQIRALTLFILNWEATAKGDFKPQELILPTPNPSSSSSKKANGEEIFVKAGCSDCHAIEGLAEATVGPELNGIGITAETRIQGYSSEEYLRESFLIPNAYRVVGYDESVLCGGVLTQSQLDDLVAFLLSLR
jgi:mono/diheme cytochrome c family protein